MVLVIDNYDSFTYNLVQYLGELGATVVVRRNDEAALDQLRALPHTRVVISPGPGRPEHAGVSLEVIKEFGARMPVLGVCLGHQALVHYYGGAIVRAPRLMHGKTSMVKHDGRTLFAGLSQPFEAGRYHSLCAEQASLPAELELTAETEQGEIMGVRHRKLPLEGVQFHPESVLTPEGNRLLANFLAMRSA